MLALRKSIANNKFGFTIVELLITISILSIVLAMVFPFIIYTFKTYFSLQYENEQYSSVGSHAQRVAGVIRGLDDIISADADELEIYAYFYPNDNYVSQIKYYLSSDQSKLLADVVPYTANPPIGAPITSQQKTYTIIDNFYKVSGINLFKYLDQDNNELSLPISSLDSIKAISVNLAVRGEQGSSPDAQSLYQTVTLRNRKTNL